LAWQGLIVDIDCRVKNGREKGPFSTFNSTFASRRHWSSHLEGLGMAVTTGVAKTGVIGILKGSKGTPVAAHQAIPPITPHFHSKHELIRVVSRATKDSKNNFGSMVSSRATLLPYFAS
jgi:hypothetical protein